MARVAEDVLRLPRGDHRVPPQNLDAEQSVLGSMMLSAEAIADVVEIVHAEDFYRSANGRIYDTIRGLYARGEPVDIITVVESLKRAGSLDDVGGHLYLRDLVDQVPTPASAGHYARIVADASLRRRLIAAAADIMERAYSAPDEADRVADDAEQRIYDVARREDRDEMAVLRELVDQAMLDLESIQNRESAYTGLPTGFRDLDTLTSGLQPGNLVVVAARPGVGKSSLAINMARNVCVGGEPVTLFSLEMSRTEIGMRLLCAEARVPWDRIRSKRVGPDDWTRVVSAAEVLHDAPLSIVDAGNVNIVDIRAKARRMKSSRTGLSMVIVDYLQLMTSPLSRRPDNRQQEVAEISRSLKLLAKELDIPIVALSQLNRNPETRADKRPQLSDLRECVTGDTLVQLADGRRVPIQQLVGKRPTVLALSKHGRLVEARSDKVWPVGDRPVVRVRLASGRSIRCTADHRLYGAGGWIRVRHLKPGNRLAIARRIPEPPHPAEWPDERVASVGRGIGLRRPYERRLPAEALRLSDRQTALLLRHLWASGGGVQIARSPGHHAVSYATTSAGLAQDVSALLLRLGIVARTSSTTRLGYRPTWSVQVSGASDQRRFLQTVGAFRPRRTPTRALALALRDRMTATRGTSERGSSLRLAPSRTVVAEHVTIPDDDGLRAAAANDLFWDRVVAIEPAGTQPVYDLTVPGLASWLAGSGSIVSHNSGAIEQDSDVVMFIHRDDTDPAKKNQADLIIAKHRNGPTGNIPLYFEPSLTQFRNAARGTDE